MRGGGGGGHDIDGVGSEPDLPEILPSRFYYAYKGAVDKAPFLLQFLVEGLGEADDGGGGRGSTCCKKSRGINCSNRTISKIHQTIPPEYLQCQIYQKGYDFSGISLDGVSLLPEKVYICHVFCRVNSTERFAFPTTLARPCGFFS